MSIRRTGKDSGSIDFVIVMAKKGKLPGLPFFWIDREKEKGYTGNSIFVTNNIII